MNTADLTNTTAGFIPAVYIHIPFCRKKCNYCDFVSADYAEKTADYTDKYLNILVNEFTSRLPAKDSVEGVEGFPLTVYIGGGTPSLLSEKQIIFLFEKIVSNLMYRDFNIIDSRLRHSGMTISPDVSFPPRIGVRGKLQRESNLPKCEITFEINPESITESKLKLLKSYGVNRLSFGLQSLDDEILKYLGRVHTVDDFKKSYELAKKTGFDNINIDLIFGVPGQTMKTWEDTLVNVLQLNPQHISVYSLTVEEGTNFFRQNVVKDDDLDADMYKFAIGFLKKNDFQQYEISNFSKPGFECKHNINYWQNGQYLGLGLGAVSYIDGKRIKNTEDIKEYFNEEFQYCVEELSDHKKVSESLMLGLRLIKGITVSDEVKKKYSYKINNLKSMGLLSEQDNLIKLSSKGVMFANHVFREFL
ncbi:MAG: radical SAM family heme chaperone HemW [Elusimicrobia bacterium]|nr:radical SAM family heme chaperone HemW [Elusimicrobiota bacterium]